MRPFPAPPSHRAAQRGVVLIYALIAMVVIMLASIALVRGTSNATSLAGAFGFRRDLVNEADRGLSCALLVFGSTTNACSNAAVVAALASTAVRNTTLRSANYSATTLQTDPKTGIPLDLLSDTQFAADGFTNALDVTDATYNVSVRFVIDRLCAAGTTAPTPATCVANNRTGDKGGTNWLPKAGTTFQPIYRISVRVTGPKNGMTFVQTMIGA
jgi:type IV pilus assembly protein PilX